MSVTYRRYSGSTWRSSTVGEDLIGKTHHTYGDGSTTLCGRPTKGSRRGFYEDEGREVDCGQCLAREEARTR